MVSRHPAKFGGHRHCGRGVIIFLGVEEPDSILSLKSTITVYLLRAWLKAHGMPYSYVRCWSHTLKAAIEEQLRNNFCQTVQKQH